MTEMKGGYRRERWTEGEGQGRGREGEYMVTLFHSYGIQQDGASQYTWMFQCCSYSGFTT